ncbi:MAG: hypothetical protein IKQ80_07490 [Clostridia bacterium]|nr:hypothetical protein [Clostridia bacterium]
MLIEELAKQIHSNAVDHGWWDDKRETPEIIALIHSEWSEALEEARAGRPMKWYACLEGDEHFPCAPADETECMNFKDRFTCMYRGKKPEGIAVELIDGCIRIFDWLGERNVKCEEKDGGPSTVESLYTESNAGKVPDKVPELIAWLHLYTAKAMTAHPIVGIDAMSLLEAAAVAMSWVKKQGLDPLALLLEKHEYNKTRPYKHGKKF